jgi:hypothetical protein
MSEETTNTNIIIDDNYSVRIYGDDVYKLHFYSGTLTVYRVTKENDEEILTPTIIQPWRTNSDGTRQNFENAADAYDWFDSYKENII